MSISADLRTQIRQRAGFACEYCGVEEIDVGGELTIDHFQPRTHQGGDELENLIYCCVRCNQYKLDYWPILVTDPVLWNPRRELRSISVTDAVAWATLKCHIWTLTVFETSTANLEINELTPYQFVYF